MVVGEHEVGVGVCQKLEEARVADLVVGVEAEAGALAAGSAGLIGEDDGAAGEGFDEQAGLGVDCAEPGADVWDQPGLAARVAEGLRWGTDATLAAGMGETGNTAIGLQHKVG